MSGLQSASAADRRCRPHKFCHIWGIEDEGNSKIELASAGHILSAAFAGDLHGFESRQPSSAAEDDCIDLECGQLGPEHLRRKSGFLSGFVHGQGW